VVHSAWNPSPSTTVVDGDSTRVVGGNAPSPDHGMPPGEEQALASAPATISPPVLVQLRPRTFASSFATPLPGGFVGNKELLPTTAGA